MATTEDSNKFIIYKGNDDDYAFIPLKISTDTYYTFTNDIIRNDGNTYIKNLNNENVTKAIKEKIIDNDAIQDKTISIIKDETYKIKNYIDNNKLTIDIRLYYIENFKYRLDVSSYYIDDNGNNDVKTRDKCMFTITPNNFKYDIDDINIDNSAPEPSNPDSSDNTGGESEDLKYDIIFSIADNTSLSLQRIDTTNDYKLTGTLILNYRQSNESIKGDVGTQVSSNLDYPSFYIVINNNKQLFKLNPRFPSGYNSEKQLWTGIIKLNIAAFNLKYTLIPGTNYENNTLQIPLNKSTPIFAKIGNKLNNYIGDESSTVNQNIYTFKLQDMLASNIIAANVYFLQSYLSSNYATWNSLVLTVMNFTSSNTRQISGIFIIISDPNVKLSDNVIVSSEFSTSQPSFNSSQFKQSNMYYNSIFTSTIVNNNVVLGAPPIFLYDENNKQTVIQQYRTDNIIFNDESSFKYKSGYKFDVSETDHKNKNVINLNNYKNIIYEYSSISYRHYCGTQLTNDTDLSKYENKTFNVVFEVWNTYRDFSSNNDLIINNNNGLVLKVMNPIYQPIDKIDNNTTIISPSQQRWVRHVTLYKLYSFKLSKTDSSTGVYEYTYTG